MDPGLLTIAIVGPCVLAVVAVISSRAASSRIPRNRSIGIRLRSTLSSDRAWTAGHRAAIRPSWYSCAVLLLAGALAMSLDAGLHATTALTLALAALVVLAITWIALASSRAAQHAR